MKYLVVLGFFEASLIDVDWPERIVFCHVNVVRGDTYHRPIEIVQPVNGSTCVSDVLVIDEPE